jgi:transposase
MLRHRLRDATWASLYARLVTLPGIWKKDPKPLRRFVEAVVYVHTGIAWADLPTTFGGAGTAYRRFRRWACKGFWPCPSGWCRRADPQPGSELAPAATAGS